MVGREQDPTKGTVKSTHSLVAKEELAVDEKTLTLRDMGIISRRLEQELRRKLRRPNFSNLPHFSVEYGERRVPLPSKSNNVNTNLTRVYLFSSDQQDRR